MRAVFPERLEAGRISNPEFGGYGNFSVQGPCGEKLRITSSSADKKRDKTSQGWEHVCVSTKRRCPNWQEMCFVKDLFWDEEETVVQFHPPKSQYINNHPYCLHLFRHKDGHALPPSIMVGIRTIHG